MIGSLIAAQLLTIGLQGRFHSLGTLLAVGTLAATIVVRPAGRRSTVLVAGGLAVAAAAVLAARTSAWVTVPSLAVLATALVAASQDRLSARSRWSAAAADYATDVVDSIRWLSQPPARLLRAGSNHGQVVRGLVLAAAVVIPLGWLLISADPIFGELLSIGVGEGFWTHATITAMLLPVVGGLVLAAHRPDRAAQAGRAGKAAAPRARAGSMVEGTIVLSAVALLLGAWGATQVVVALGGADRLSTTVNLTAAQNARHGFFQLVAVTALLVVVVVAIDRYVDRATGGQRLCFLGLTSLIGLETVGVVFATYSRLSLYIHGFGYTMLRTAVAWFLAWLAVVMAMLIVAMNRRVSGTDHIGGPLFVLAALWVIGFGASNPEGFVARGNLERRTEVTLDARYLIDQLGPDAVPTIVEMLPTQTTGTRAELTEVLCRGAAGDNGEGFLGWNLAAGRAEDAVRRLDCG